MGSQDKGEPVIDNPLRFTDAQKTGYPQAIVKELEWLRSRLSGFSNPPDTMAIMHVLEQIKNEMRTLVSEVSTMAMELANLRRLSQPQPPWRS